MPYKSEKINIVNTPYDRRRKLTEDQKEYIRWLREEEQLSQRALAAMFGVSRRLITFVLNPEKERRSRENFKKRKSMGMYRPTKEEWAETMRNHRHYKQQLYTEGKIQEQQKQKEESYEQQ